MEKRQSVAVPAGTMEGRNRDGSNGPCTCRCRPRMVLVCASAAASPMDPSETSFPVQVIRELLIDRSPALYYYPWKECSRDRRVRLSRYPVKLQNVVAKGAFSLGIVHGELGKSFGSGGCATCDL